MYKCLVFLQLWPVISSVCTTYQADQRITERTCRYELVSCFSCVMCFKLQLVSNCSRGDIVVLGVNGLSLCRCVRFMVRCVGKSAVSVISPLVTMVRGALHSVVSYEFYCPCLLSPFPLSLPPSLPLSLPPSLPLSLPPSLPPSLSPSLPPSLSPSLPLSGSLNLPCSPSLLLSLPGVHHCRRVWLR